MDGTKAVLTRKLISPLSLSHLQWPHEQELLQMCVEASLVFFITVSVLNIEIQGPATESQAALLTALIQEVSLGIIVIHYAMTKSLHFRLRAEILPHHLPVMGLSNHSLNLLQLPTISFHWNGGNHNLPFTLIPPFETTVVKGDVDFDQLTVMKLMKTAEVPAMYHWISPVFLFM